VFACKVFFAASSAQPVPGQEPDVYAELQVQDSSLVLGYHTLAEAPLHADALVNPLMGDPTASVEYLLSLRDDSGQTYHIDFFIVTVEWLLTFIEDMEDTKNMFLRFAESGDEKPISLVVNRKVFHLDPDAISLNYEE